VDFLGSKAGSSLQEFIGRSIVGKLKNILSGNPPSDPIPIPWVCQVIPDQVELVPFGDRLLFSEGVITLTGYNYTDTNTPRAYVLDETGSQVAGVPLYPFRSSPYQIQLNLQGLDLSAIPPRSRIVFEWPNVTETTGVAILMPVANPPVASFTFTPTSGVAPLSVQFTDTSTGDPSRWSWTFGDGTTSNERNPSHTFGEALSFEVVLQVENALGSSDVSQALVVGEALAADFTFQPRVGDAPFIVDFQDRSSGNPAAWEWNFGDGESSTEQNPSHLYTIPKPDGYTVTLRINREDQTDSKSSADRIMVR
jgi:PKD repeat protein